MQKVSKQRRNICITHKWTHSVPKEHPMKKLSLFAVAMIIVAATLPGCWCRKKSESSCTKCCATEIRESGPMQDLQEEDMK